MNLNKADFEQILRKYLNGQATKKETDFLHAYYNAFEHTPDFTDKLSPEEKLFLESKIKNRLLSDIDTKTPIRKVKLNFFRYAAAILLAVVALWAYLSYFNSFNPKTNQEKWVKKHIANTRGIVLKLADGTEINLDNDALTSSIKENGATIESDETGALNYKASTDQLALENVFNEVAVPFGKQFKITLADGTNVWLNAASSLKYPVAFQSAKREVYLTGEGYFEVSKDTSKPFIVHSKESQIEVTGTEFNINAYPDQTLVKTTLLEGSVRVGFANQNLNLIPGEQSISNLPNQPITKYKANIESVIAWKSGYFVFNQPLKEVMNALSRWYGKKITLDKRIENSTVAGRFSNKRSLMQILNYIGQLKGFDVVANNEVIELKMKN